MTPTNLLQGSLRLVRYNSSNQLNFHVQRYVGAIQLGQLVKPDFFVNLKTPTPIPIGGLRHGLGFVCPEPCFQALIRSHLHDSALLAELDTG